MTNQKKKRENCPGESHLLRAVAEELDLPLPKLWPKMALA